MPRKPRVIYGEVSFAENVDPEVGMRAWCRATQLLMEARAVRLERERLAELAQVDLNSRSPSIQLIADPQPLIADFLTAARLAGQILTADDITYECLPAPHRRPTRLPIGKMAVYVFACGDRCLKVGKAGEKTNARFTSQHYLPKSANSTLSSSMLKHARSDKLTPDEVSELVVIWRGLKNDTVGDWLQEHTTRYHFFLDATQPAVLLSLLEAFLQCRLTPLFEG